MKYKKEQVLVDVWRSTWYEVTKDCSVAASNKVWDITIMPVIIHIRSGVLNSNQFGEGLS